MKRNLMNYAAVGTMLLLLTNPSFGEDKHEDKHAVKHMVNASDVIGSDLWDFQGNKIGSIDRVLLEPAGKTVLAIINADELLEEDREVAIPWSKVYVRTKADDADEVIYTLDVTKERLFEAPVWMSDADATDPTKADAVFRFWKVERDGAEIKAGRLGERLDRTTEKPVQRQDEAEVDEDEVDES